MPISQSILEQIEKSDVDDNQKTLMKVLLEIEDSGLYQYKSTYRKLIKEFAEKKETDDHGNTD